jgi:hypothetical protein
VSSKIVNKKTNLCITKKFESTKVLHSKFRIIMTMS